MLKHAALAFALDYLVKKSKPIVVIDAFAAGGLVDLALDGRAERGDEWRAGAGRLWPPATDETAAEAAALGAFRVAIARRNTLDALRFLPGSPLVALERMRPDDKLLAVEAHPEEAAALRATLAGDRRTRVYAEDGWAALRSFLPPTPRRGLVLIDPPFERPGEYKRMASALADGLRRWSQGAFILWHAIKDEAAAAAYVAEAGAIAAAAGAPCLLAELRVREPGDGLHGSGVVIVNPPFDMETSLAAFGEIAAARLAPAAGARPAKEVGWRQAWLCPRR